MFKCPNDCVGKLPTTFEGHTIRQFIRFECRIRSDRCSNQASGLEGSC